MAGNQPFEYQNYLNGIKKLYPMPGVLAQAHAKLKDPTTEIDDLAATLRSDTAIVSDLIRYSNSAYYGYSSEVRNLTEAIQRIGFRDIVRMLGVAIAQRLYSKELAHYRISPTVFWESSVSGAIVMERIALKAKQDFNDAYIVGLMREVGMIIIDYILCMKSIDKQWDNYTPILDWESEACGSDHTVAGAAILRNWKFPDTVIDAIDNQWVPLDEGDNSFFRVALYLTNQMLAKVGCDFCIPCHNFETFLPVGERLGFDLSDIEEIYDKCAIEFYKMRDVVAAA